MLQNSHMSGHSIGAAGHIQSQQPTSTFRHQQYPRTGAVGRATREDGLRRVVDVKNALGNHRVFTPDDCPRHLKTVSRVDLGQSELFNIPLGLGYLRLMTEDPSYGHFHLFCVPKISALQIVSALPEMFGDIRGLCSTVGAKVPRWNVPDWRWGVFPQAQTKINPSGQFHLPDFMYLQAVYRLSSGKNFFAGRLVCPTGMNRGTVINVEEDGTMTIPKWDGIGQEFHAHGFLTTH